MSRPSQKLIAEKLGISTATVSLALRGKGTISAELAAQVRAMADSMGYRPNPMLSSLASKRFRRVNESDTIPVAMIDFINKNVGTDLYAPSISSRAQELGYSLTTISAKELGRYNRPCQTLHNRGVEGIIIVGPVESTAFRENFEWDLFSVIQCGRFFEPLPFDTVRPNIFQSIKMAFRKAIARGYRRIGFGFGLHITVLEDDESRLATALALQQLEQAPEDRVPPFLGSLGDRDAFLDWAKAHRPDCIIGFHIGQCAHLVEHGIQVPGDVGFICLHLSGVQSLNSDGSLCFSGTDQNYKEIATQSMNLLDQKIQYHEKGAPLLPKHVLVPSSWIEGETLPDRS